MGCRIEAVSIVLNFIMAYGFGVYLKRFSLEMVLDYERDVTCKVQYHLPLVQRDCTFSLTFLILISVLL